MFLSWTDFITGSDAENSPRKQQNVFYNLFSCWNETLNPAVPVCSSASDLRNLTVNCVITSTWAEAGWPLLVSMWNYNSCTLNKTESGSWGRKITSLQDLTLSQFSGMRETLRALIQLQHVIHLHMFSPDLNSPVWPGSSGTTLIVITPEVQSNHLLSYDTVLPSARRKDVMSQLWRIISKNRGAK